MDVGSEFGGSNRYGWRASGALAKIALPRGASCHGGSGGRIDGEDAKAAKHYTRAAGQWQQKYFAGSIQSLIGWPGATLTRFAQSHPGFRADLLHINGINPTFLSGYGAGVEMLEPGGYIIISCSRVDHLRARIQRLTLNGDISATLGYAVFVPRHGAFAVLRRL